jgi:hypothetical protein
VTYHYRDTDGHHLTAEPDTDLNSRQVVTLWARGEYDTRVPVRIPLDRIEELIAGLRDTARQAAAQEQPA